MARGRQPAAPGRGGAVSVRRVRGTVRRFLTFPWQIYRGDPNWVPPLLPEVGKRFSPEHGAVAGRGEVAAFLAYRGLRRVGRIAVAEDRAMNENTGSRDCLIGFFESTDDQGVANALFSTADEWAARRGLRRLHGPFDLDYEDSYGVLIDGRDRPPTLLCGHSPAYYADLFEQAGFTPARPENIAIEVDIPKNRKRLEWLARLGAKALSGRRGGPDGGGGRCSGHAGRREKPAICVREADFADPEGEIDRLHRLLNESMRHLTDSMGWERSSVRELVYSLKPVADPRYILFLDVEGETVGWFAGIPNVNEIFIHLNGLRFPWDYLRLLAHGRDRPQCLSAKSILVLPRRWHSRASIALLGEMARRVLESPYRWVDLSLTSVDNPETPKLAARVGGRIYKRYQVYERSVQTARGRG